MNGDRQAQQGSRGGRRAAYSVALSMIDQATYGLSTYLVTATAARTSDAAGLGRFMLLWGSAWLTLSLLSAALLLPIRLALARKEIAPSQVRGLQYAAFAAGGAATAAAAGLQLLQQSVAADLASCAAVTIVGLAYALKRGLAYQHGRESLAATCSSANLAATLPLLGLLLLTEQPVTHWGLLVAAIALIPAALPAAADRWHWRDGLRLVLSFKRESFWNAVSTAAGGWVFGVGLMGLVASTRGITEAGHMAQLLVLVTPVQLASQTLPMLTLHRLAAAALVGPHAFRREWRWDLRVYAVLAALGFGGLYVVYDTWSGLILGPSDTPVPWLATTMCGVGILFSSWAGTALWASQSARNLLAGNALAGLGMLAGDLLGVPTLYLVALPYWVAPGCHAALVWWWLHRRADTGPPAEDRVPATDRVPAESIEGRRG